MYTKKIISLFIGILCLFTSGLISAEKPLDADALSDVNEGKVVWDVTVGSPIKLLLLMKVIEETYDDLVRQDVKPDMVFAFHGPVLKLISSEPLDLPLDEEEAHEEVLDLLREFSQKPGVKMESCSIAARLLSIDNDTIMPEVKPVGNTFVSLIGYQKKGYALIPIY
ncbi:MAG: DsrE family protein [Gammaproteobacteria bacterium]|nr:DsrE family protein [Gammaproteobacteria bacterium]